MNALHLSLSRRPRGFTAVEIAMVATVIAILALLVLPLFRKRVDESREVATRDELSSIAKAQLLVEADMGRPARLFDLDNTIEGGGLSTELDPPTVAWNGASFGATGISDRWQGPYAAYQNAISIDALAASRTYLFSSETIAGGPIFVLESERSDNNWRINERYPLDPYGNPYLFFGNGPYPAPAVGTPPQDVGYLGSNESLYNSTYNVIYSLGPNGLPGDQFSTASDAYFPAYDIAGDTATYGAGLLGLGDDFSYRY